MTGSRERWLALLAASVMVACQANLSVPVDAQLQCHTSAECPSGRFCNAFNLCVAATEADTSQPVATASVTPSVGRKGVTFTISLDISKPLKSPPVVSLRVTPAPAIEPQCTSVSTTQYTCTYTALGTENQDTGGLIYFDVAMIDLDGNEPTQAKVGALNMDFTPPSLVGSSVSPSIVGHEGTIHIFLTASEALSPDAGVYIVPDVPLDGGSSLLATNDPMSSNYRVDYVLQDDPGGIVDPNGLVKFYVSLTDVAGNTTVNPLEIGSTTIDQTVPLISGWDAGGPDYSEIPPYNDLTLTFNVAKAVDGAGELTATVGGQPFSTCVSNGATPPLYTCQYTVQGTEAPGAQLVVMQAQDEAGNSDVETTTVSFDFSKPILAAAFTSPTAGSGAVPLLALTSTKSLMTAGLVSVTSDPSATGSLGTPVIAGSGTAWTFAFPAAAAPLKGTFDVTVSGTDQVGHVVDIDAKITVDANVPSITQVTTTDGQQGATRFSGVSPYNQITLTFEASKALMTSSATFGRCPTASAPTAACVFQPCVPSTADPLSYSCTYTVTTQEQTANGQAIIGLTEATVPISIVGADSVGNSASAGATITLDFAAPLLLSSAVSLPIIGVNQVESLVLSVSEQLQGTPSIATTPEVLGFEPVSGTSDTFTYTVLAGDMSDVYTPEITMTDLVGNTSAPIPAATFTVDTSIPAISNVQTNAPVYSEVTGYNVVTLTFGVTKDVGSQAPGLQALLGERSMSCSAYDVATASYTCTYTTSTTNDASGPQVISIQTLDDAGNSDAAATSVTFDFSPLALASKLNPSPARLNDVPSMNVVSNKPLNAAPQVSPASALGTPSVMGMATSWLLTFPAAAPPLQGTYSVTALATDVVGHTASTTSSDTVDAVTPVLSNVQTNGSRFSAVAGFNTVSVTFDCSKSVDTAPASLNVQLGQYAMTCGSYMGTTSSYTCTYTVTGQETANGMPVSQVDFPVGIRAIDEAGNETSAGATVTLDFSPPSFVGTPSLVYLPLAGNPLQTVTAATVGTDIRVSFSLSEASIPPVVTSAPSGLAFTQSGAAGNSYAYDTTIKAAGSPADSTYALSVIATDLVGNTTTLVANLSAQIDTTPPAAPDTATSQRVVYTRIPWGDKTSVTSGSPVASFTIVGQPNAALGSSVVVAYDGPNPALASQIGEATTTPAGGGFNMTLSRSDRVQVYVAGVDEAGNVSTTPAQVHDVTWAATFGGKQSGSVLSNPHTLTEDASLLFENTASPFLGTLSPDATESLEASSYSNVLLPDGLSLTSTATASEWIDRPQPQTVPTARIYFSMAYDSARGRTVMFGGNSTTDTGDTWEWDGEQWLNVTPANGSPAPREQYALAYDSLRGRTVLFGGLVGAGLVNETWEWDGSNWTQLSPAQSPPVRTAPSMVFDAATGQCVLFGGYIANGNSTTYFGDTWLWNGTTWTQAMPATSPSARAFGAMAYDAAHGLVVLFSGSGVSGLPTDTWTWNGTTWTKLTPATSPPGREEGAMTFDSVHGLVLLFGGVDPGMLNDTWTWNGTTWASVTPAAAPSARYLHGLAFDSVHGNAVLFGGLSTVAGSPNSVGDTWLWNGTNWIVESPTTTWPSARFQSAGAFDSVRDRTVIFGGYSSTSLNDTWEWTGGGWVQGAPTAIPPVRSSHMMTYDSVRQNTVLFGGYGTAPLNDTWTWNGTNWTSLKPVTVPSARSDAALVFDSGHSVAVLFGGASGTGNLADTWTWNGTTWANVSPSSGSPPSRSNHVMAYDAGRGRVVLFGGTGAGGALSPLDDTWEWNGSTWTNVTPVSPNPSPVGRYWASVTYDAGRGRVVLTGGTSSNSSANDTWEWNGSVWTNVTTAVAPTGRDQSVMVYDTNRATSVLVGGFSLTGQILNDVWELPSATSRRSAQLAQFSFGATGESVTTPPTIEQMTFDAYALGQGNGVTVPGSGAASVGANMAVWSASSGDWVKIGSNTTALGVTPTEMTYTTASATEATSYLLVRPQTIDVALFSPSRGNGVATTELQLDYVELTVQYHH